MTAQNLAKIERVDLREAWPNEAKDFTPWLAENIGELGEALGMDLELQGTEAVVGGYSLDVLATNLNRPVAIENQLEPTNHDHLGKLLTYAAGYDANVVVWLSREFRDEHRQALDWLNQRTGEDTQFFGVVVELWRIGNSSPAPHFNVIATPNGWRKETAARVKGGTSSVTVRQEQYREFFQPLVDTLREVHKFTNMRKAPGANVCLFASGHPQFKYWASINELLVRIDLRIETGDRELNLAHLENLEQSKEQIEIENGKALNWERMESNRGCRIATTCPRNIGNDDDIREWMANNLLKFRQVFGPRLAELVEQQSAIQEQQTFD